jgi:tagatose-6-phosphate ketose/aldose isomerase
MKLFGLGAHEIDAQGAHWTAREIAQQPGLWRKVAHGGAGVAGGVGGAGALPDLLAPLLGLPGVRILLTGAGSSSFIGECLAPAISRAGGPRAVPVATTDLVADPAAWFAPASPTLLVSFARSGDSPESMAAVELADRHVAQCHHLVFTCNAQGALYRRANQARNSWVQLLPDEANDRSFAMTSSFSTMLLAASLGIGRVDAGFAAATEALAAAAQHLLDGIAPRIRGLVEERFGRVVFLGAREFKGLAREAALKLLELSDGRILAVADTPLGFRHGPKTIVKSDTLVVVFVSNDPIARKYDLDLLRELRKEAVAGRVLALGARPFADAAHPDDLQLAGLELASDLQLCLPFVVFAQVFALLQSMALGLRPDEPNEAGVVSRVVRGVTIHPPPPAP